MTSGLLVFVGTHHHDPNGPEILGELLSALVGRYGTPAFIAVEAARRTTEAAIARREEYRREFVAEGGQIAAIAADLSPLPMYEAEVAMAQAAGGEVVYLLEGRDADDSVESARRSGQTLLGRVQAVLMAPVSNDSQRLSAHARWILEYASDIEVGVSNVN